MAITRNRYGKHMRDILSIVTQAPGEWYTLAADLQVRNAAARLERKGLIHLSSDGSEARYIVQHVVPVAGDDKPDGWIMARVYVWRDPEYRVLFNEAKVEEVLKDNSVRGESERWTARPFKFIGE